MEIVGDDGRGQRKVAHTCKSGGDLAFWLGTAPTIEERSGNSYVQQLSTPRRRDSKRGVDGLEVSPSPASRTDRDSRMVDEIDVSDSSLQESGKVDMVDYKTVAKTCNGTPSINAIGPYFFSSKFAHVKYPSVTRFTIVTSSSSITHRIVGSYSSGHWRCNAHYFVGVLFPASGIATGTIIRAFDTPKTPPTKVPLTLLFTSLLHRSTP
ncbi:hypothetical protein VNO77_34398 [Canavalia gladiata]|uniref:Uncharacterized protein n=1 Tax=Canavalia gladiata TaxID=3824 RepID=A0AAN9KDI5_CANGL